MSGIMVTIIFDDEEEYTNEEFAKLADKTVKSIEALDSVDSVEVEDTFD